LTANKEKTEILYLITARSGSTRFPGKNLMKIGNHSLIAYKAISARKSKYRFNRDEGSDEIGHSSPSLQHTRQCPLRVISRHNCQP